MYFFTIYGVSIALNLFTSSINLQTSYYSTYTNIVFIIGLELFIETFKAIIDVRNPIVQRYKV